MIKIYGVLLTFSPAAADTLSRYFNDSGTNPKDFDAIFTGDLGHIGSELLSELLQEKGIELLNHFDCGKLMFDRERQDVHAGGSGCGCCASVLCGYILPKMLDGELGNILFCATGALLSPTSTQQGDSIPCIAHLVNIKRAD